MAWQDISYSSEDIEVVSRSAFLESLRHIYANGGVVLRSFRVVNAADFDHTVRTISCERDYILRTFLTRPSVITSVPELRIEVPFKRPPEFVFLSAFGMEGELTSMLLTGGAYERFRGSVEEARGLSRQFMEALF